MTDSPMFLINLTNRKSPTKWNFHVLVKCPGGGGTLRISGWGCAAGTLEPSPIPELVQQNFATLY